MKTIKNAILTLVLISVLQPTLCAQTFNWASLENSKHILNVGIGWDYSLSYNLAYAHQANTRIPLMLNTNFSVPSGGNLLDDFKTKIGGQMVLLNKASFKGSITLNGIYRRYQNPLVRLQNLGCEMKSVMGYYRPKWFIAAELGFDKAIVTHFKHAESYKENIFRGVEDGWYQPATGGNFLYGVQTGYSFNKSDITLNIGMVKTQDLKSNPLIPYYLMFGYNYKVH